MGRDVIRFADALIFNWLIAGTDAHANNFSMLIAGGGRARLAPLYDLASALPYPQLVQPRKTKLAMKIGSHYRIQEIRRGDWEKLARELRLPVAKIADRIKDMARQIAATSGAVAQSIEKDGITHPVIRMLATSLASHVRERVGQMEKPH
jgi:serine/threonine-protein kinase HipA